MRIHDLMPSYSRFTESVARLISPGAEGPAASSARETDIMAAFEREYVEPNRIFLEPLLADLAGWSRPLVETLAGFDVERARRAIATAARRGYPERARRTVDAVEAFFRRSFDQDMALIAGLGRIDGYARFERGGHVVYIGVDYPESADHYLDLIIAHETGHVVREGNPRTWEPHGLAVGDMTHDDFTERCPFEEHMVGEGLSTALSEEIYPGYPLHEYLYFTPEQHQWCVENESRIAEGLRAFLGTRETHYNLYGRDAIAPGSPERTQYYFGWMLVRRLVKERGMDLRELNEMPARRILEAAAYLKS